MSLLNIAENIIFNINEKKKKYIYSVLNDYDDYIEREKQSLKSDITQDKKLLVITNIAAAYFNMGNYEKAIRMMKILDDYELNDDMTFLYYINLITFYICSNDEQSVDLLYDEAKIIMKKFYKKYTEAIELYTIRYLNFKGRYEDSLNVLNRNRIKNTDSDIYNLLVADIAFNTNEFDEGSYIINEMCKTYYEKEPCIQKQIDVLMNNYMRNSTVEKTGQVNDDSIEKKIWNKVKDSESKTILLFTFIDAKKLFKKKWFSYAILPFIITAFLCRIVIPVLLGDIYSEVIINVISFLFLSYMLIGFGYIAIKHTRKCKNGLIPAVVITFIVINLLMGFYVSDFSNNIMDFKYAITKTNLSDSGKIRILKIKPGSKQSFMEIKINNTLFIIHENDDLYDYIKSDFKEGNKVNIEYLPHSKKLIKIEKI